MTPIKGLVKYYLSMIQGNNDSTEPCNIFVACFPKSGSTYLTTLLCEITSFEKIAAVQTYEGVQYWYSEQDLYENQLQKISIMNSVTQQHTKGSSDNVGLLKKYNVKPVILVRNIFDVLVSLYDHIENEDHRQPMGYVHKDYFKMGKEEKLDFLIKTHIPWYFNFVMSWREASKEMDALWVTYEQVFSDQLSTVQSILDFYDIPKEENEIQRAIQCMAMKETRFNRGVSGRGKCVSEKHKEEIDNMAKVWKVRPNEVFKLIGIEE